MERGVTPHCGKCRRPILALRGAFLTAKSQPSRPQLLGNKPSDALGKDLGAA
jgi:hypothetical protein